MAATPFTLTILHNNDGESKLLGNNPAGFGGADFFVTVVENQRAAAVAAGNAVVTISSGDNFLAGTTFAASFADGTFYDAIVISEIGYDAVTLGNHDFDFGPATLADFIAEVDASIPFISCNLNFDAEPGLAALETAGRIASSVIVDRNIGGDTVSIGIIGLTTPTILTVSSPGNVGVGTDVLAAVQAEVTALEGMGIDHIILSSHLQGIESEKTLAEELRGVDVIIAGGGDELLANPGDLLLPGDEAVIHDNYPIIAQDADDNDVPIVTTTGEYRYLGRLDVEFDANGDVVSAAGGPVRVARSDASTPAADAVTPHTSTKENAVDPVAAFVQSLAATVVGSTEVALDGRRVAVRAIETNEGNLIADAFLAAAKLRAATFGADEPVIALTNGGGIRNDSIVPVGELSLKTTFDIAPFGNFVAIVEDVPVGALKRILENAYSQTVRDDEGNVSQGAANTGRFAQIAGMQVLYDIDAPGSILNADGNVLADGARILDITLDSGVKLLEGGFPVEEAPATVDIATTSFLAAGGDGYPFGDAAFVTVGITDQQALAEYIQGLSGSQVPAALYADATSRIRLVPMTTALVPPLVVAKKNVKVSEKARSVRIRGTASANTAFVLVGTKLARGTTSWSAKIKLPDGAKRIRVPVRIVSTDGLLTTTTVVIKRR